MHELLLRPHPDSDAGAVTQIAAKLDRSRAGILALSYVVKGRIGDIRMPNRTAAERSDALWHHTCFEAFVGAGSAKAYYEFNFSPSTRWAAYRFNGYRSGMCEAVEVGSPSIGVNASADCYTLQASLEVDWLSALPRLSLWRLGLSAVIEDKQGHKSYWALEHPPGKPDFHHADCFSYEFSPVGPA